MKRSYTNYLFFVVLIASGFITGCVKNTPAVAPTYVHVDSFTFQNKYIVNLLTNSHKITQVWAYYNNNVIGAFDLPATFPIITNGASGKLELSPAIAMDGLNDFIAVYPFYTIDTSTLITQPGKIVTKQPVTSFYNDVKVTSLDNFTSVYTLSPYSSNLYFQLGHDYYGNSSGSITLSASDTLEDSCARFAASTGTTFVEFDYKSTVPFYVGLAANESSYISSTPFYLSGISPSDTWQKFYLSIQDFEAQYQGTQYNFFIKAYLPPGYTTGSVSLANIQLISF